jgi:hypothetical protein
MDARSDSEPRAVLAVAMDLRRGDRIGREEESD